MNVQEIITAVAAYAIGRIVQFAKDVSRGIGPKRDRGGKK